MKRRDCINIIMICFLLLIGKIALSQAYTKGSQVIVSPAQVLPYHYQLIPLQEHGAPLSGLNQFDNSNLYTYLQLIFDKAGTVYHVLYQTNFTGKILYLAYSNELVQVFEKKQRLSPAFRNCISMLNNYWMASQNAEAAINCILNRLNEGFE
jgi:hypothetical protein